MLVFPMLHHEINSDISERLDNSYKSKKHKDNTKNYTIRLEMTRENMNTVVGFEVVTWQL
jgi:hypothetical protein